MTNSKAGKMKDKNKLKKLVEIIGELLKEEGNEWLIDEIMKTIEIVSPVEEIAKHSLIQSIHEYCVEQKIEKQAKEFYASFPIAEIKDQLILDYVKMEHERRRDDFENFCLCMYQQIENICNYLFDNKIMSSWDYEKNKIAVKSRFDSIKKEYTIPGNGGTTLEQLVFEGQSTSTWYANRKFRAVLYFFYFNENVINAYGFNSISINYQEIYQMRNQNHRGSKPNSYQQKVLDEIKGNESKYYFKFYGFLQDFIDKIESSYSTTSNSSRKHQKVRKPNIQKNTIGANIPELEKIRQQLGEKK